MDEYIKQLIEELEQAVSARVNSDLESKWNELKHPFDEIENYISGSEDQPFEQICNLKNAGFPPASQLSFAQMNLLSNGLLDLMLVYNIYANLPELLPVKKAYSLLVEALSQPLTIIEDGMAGLEFCDYDPNKCPFGVNFCSCIQELHSFSDYSLEMLKYPQAQPDMLPAALFARIETFPDLIQVYRDKQSFSNEEDSDGDLPF